MSDNALKNTKAKKKQLLDRKAELRREREKVDAELQEVEKFLALYEAFSASEQEPLPNFRAESPREKAKDVRSRTNSSKEEVAEAARVVIASRARPVMRADLYQELVNMGLKIDGKDPEMVLSTMLWRQKDKVVRLKGRGGYWLPERPWEPAGYEPTEEALRQYERREFVSKAVATVEALNETRAKAREEFDRAMKH